MLLGTIAYMSPEQARAEPVGSPTDVFSLGIVLYELATGRHPLQAESTIGTLHAILSQAPMAASCLRPDLPAVFDALLLRMLEKDPRLRPSAKEVSTVLSKEGLLRSTSGWGRVVSPVKRHTVGREAERARLHRAYEMAVGGRGTLLCVTGEPGIGKTTLIEDFLGELGASKEACFVARGRCAERLAGAEAYLPILEALDSLLKAHPTDAAQEMKTLAPTWYVQVAPLATDDSSVQRVLADANMASQERMKREMVALLTHMAHMRPLVMFLDDLHRADVARIDLLAYVATHFDRMRVLIAGTYRPSELLLANHPLAIVMLELQGRGVCEEVTLEFLNADEMDRYLAMQFPEHHFPDDLPVLIHTKTEGSPLFMTDLVRYLRDQGMIAEQDGYWQLARPIPDLTCELPASMRSMIQRKIDQLDDADCRLLVAASVQATSSTVRWWPERWNSKRATWKIGLRTWNVCTRSSSSFASTSFPTQR